MKLIPSGKLFKGFPFFILMFLGTIYAKGQSWEIGLGLGGTTYTGDIVRTYRFLENRPSGMLFVRYNLNNAFSVRAAGMVGGLQAEDDQPFDPVAGKRDARFSRLVMEGAITFEYHFLDYKSEDAWINYSPYLFAGFGLSAFTNKNSPTVEYSSIQPVIPVGLGFKYLLTPNWTLGVEFGARKTFFDYIDEISEGNQIRKKEFNFGNAYDNDWYYFLGFTLSYTFYSVPCPYNPNGGLFY